MLPFWISRNADLVCRPSLELTWVVPDESHESALERMVGTVNVLEPFWVGDCDLVSMFTAKECKLAALKCSELMGCFCARALITILVFGVDGRDIHRDGRRLRPSQRPRFDRWVHAGLKYSWFWPAMRKREACDDGVAEMRGTKTEDAASPRLIDVDKKRSLGFGALYFTAHVCQMLLHRPRRP